MFPSTYFYVHFGILHKKELMETLRCAKTLKMYIKKIYALNWGYVMWLRWDNITKNKIIWLHLLCFISVLCDVIYYIQKKTHKKTLQLLLLQQRQFIRKLWFCSLHLARWKRCFIRRFCVIFQCCAQVQFTTLDGNKANGNLNCLATNMLQISSFGSAEERKSALEHEGEQLMSNFHF